MAIKYLAGERLIGTAAERAALTVSASAGFTTSHVGEIYISSGELKHNVTRDGTLRVAYIDTWSGTGLSASPSTWAWTFKWIVDPRTVTGGLASYFYFSSSTAQQDSDGSGQSGNSVVYVFDCRTANEAAGEGYSQLGLGNVQWYNLGSYGNYNNTYNDTPLLDNGSTTYTFWIKMTKNGNTFTIDRYDSEANLESGTTCTDCEQYTLTNSTAGAFTNLRYLKLHANAAGSTTGTCLIHYDDLKYFSGTTTITGTPDLEYSFSDVVPLLSNGTLFEESDTGKIYMFDGTSTWNEIT